MFNYPVGSSGAPKKKPAPQAGPMVAEPEQEMGEAEDGAEIAQAHGPAHEVHLQHDHEGGQHHVHSMHPDGHEHHSDHESADAAHEHGKKLAGAGSEHAEPDGDEAY